MRAVFAALLANLGIAAVKFIAFVITGSASMLAESVHSLADTGNEVLLLVGRGRSGRPRSEEHPFGYGRERYFYGFVVSVMLFTVGAAFSVYDGSKKIMHPEPVHAPAVALVVLGLAAVLEAFSLRTGIREANQVRGERSWGTFIRRSKAPELPVVLLEDVAALIGLGFAFIGVSLAWLTGQGWWDGVGSLAIGLLLAAAAAILAVETKSLLIGESASVEVERQIVAAIEDGPEVERVIHLRTVHIGPESILVAAKIAVHSTDTAAQIAAGIDAAERRVRAVVPMADTIYLEPDLYRPSMSDRTDPSIRAARRPRSSLRSRGPRLSACASRRQVEQAQRAFLFEVEGASWRRWYPAKAPGQIDDGGAYTRFCQHPQAERQGSGRDVIPLLQFERGGHRGEILLAELPMRGSARGGGFARGASVRRVSARRGAARGGSRQPAGPAGPAHRVSDRRQQAEVFSVTQHPRRCAEPPRGCRNTHSDKFTSKTSLERCGQAARSRTVAP